MKIEFIAAINALMLMHLPNLNASEPLTLPASYWQDDVLLKSFSASYGVNARVEPSVSLEEQKLLVRVAQSMKKGDKKRALEILQGSGNTKKSAALSYNQANIYLELGNEELAVDSYKQAINMYPSFRRAYKNLGLTYLRSEQFAQALACLVKAVSLGDMAGSTLGMLAYCHMQNEHYASALQAYRMAQLTEPTVIEWKAGVAQSLLEIGQGEEAFALMEEVVAARPNELSYQLLMVNMLLQRGENIKAIAALEWLGRQEKLSLDQVTLLAQLHTQNGTLDLAEPWFERVKNSLTIEVYPLYLQAIESVLQLAEWELAEQLLSVNPDGVTLNGDLLNKRDRLRSIVLIEQKKEGAKDLLEALIIRDPLDGDALVLMARVSFTEGELGAAEFYFRRAEKIESSKYAALFGYGTMLVSQKKYRAAVLKFEFAQKLHPTPAQAKYIEALRRVAGE